MVTKQVAALLGNLGGGLGVVHRKPGGVLDHFAKLVAAVPVGKVFGSSVNHTHAL